MHQRTPLSLFVGAIAWLAVTLATPSPASAGDTYRVGSTVAAFSAADQFGKPFQLGADCRVLLISFDMGTGKQANAKLTALGKDYLPSHRATYVANIAGMPAIGRAFALPKMRSYSHRIILADEPAVLAPFPHQDHSVTVLHLSDRKITSIGYWNPEKEALAHSLGQ